MGHQQGPMLWYVEHNAAVAVVAEQSGYGWVRFSPDDPVTRINGYTPEYIAEAYADAATSDTWIAMSDWHGFGTYVAAQGP